MSIVRRRELCTYLFFSPFPPKREFWYCRWVKRLYGPCLGMVGMNAYLGLGTVQDTWAPQRCTGECPWSPVSYSHVWDCQGNWYLQQTLLRATVIRWEAHRRDSYIISPGPAHCKRILNSWDSGPGTRKGKWAKGIPSLGSRVNQRQREARSITVFEKLQAHCRRDLGMIYSYSYYFQIQKKNRNNYILWFSSTY